MLPQTAAWGSSLEALSGSDSPLAKSRRKWINQSTLAPCPLYLCSHVQRRSHTFLVTVEQLAQMLSIITLAADSRKLKRRSRFRLGK